MLSIKYIDKTNIEYCAEIYIEAYSKAPWNEIHEVKDVKEYFNRFLKRNYNYGWVLYEDMKVLGIALGSIIPTTGQDFCRIEDLCIIPSQQRKGYGSKFLDLISGELKKYNADSIILNTVKDFPSYKFYKKNKFEEVDTSVMLYKDI